MFNRTYNAANVNADKEGGDFKPIPPGEYRVQIVKAEDAVSQSSGKDMIRLEIEIIDLGEFAGRKLWQYIVDDQYADQKVYDILTACGKPIPQQITSGIFVNLTGRVKTKNRIYNGKESAEINYWLRPKPGETPAQPVNTNPADDIPFN